MSVFLHSDFFFQQLNSPCTVTILSAFFLRWIPSFLAAQGTFFQAFTNQSAIQSEIIKIQSSQNIAHLLELNICMEHTFFFLSIRANWVEAQYVQEFSNLSLKLCLMVCLISKLISWSDIAFDRNTAMVSFKYSNLNIQMSLTWALQWSL